MTTRVGIAPGIGAAAQLLVGGIGEDPVAPVRLLDALVDGDADASGSGLGGLLVVGAVIETTAAGETVLVRDGYTLA